MNLFADIRALVVAELTAMTAEGTLPQGLDFANVAVEPPRDAAHGDMATNAAMVLAKPAGLAPRVIADALAARLGKDARIMAADVAGPTEAEASVDGAADDANASATRPATAVDPAVARRAAEIGALLGELERLGS
jgi:arginyl-tRNA synthetase